MNKKTLKTKWRSAYICYGCKEIDSFDGAYLTCRNCGSTNGSFTSVRDVYEIKTFFKILKIPIHQKVEIKECSIL